MSHHDTDRQTGQMTHVEHCRTSTAYPVNN